MQILYDPTSSSGRELLREAYSPDTFRILSCPQIFGLRLLDFQMPTIEARKALIVGPMASNFESHFSCWHDQNRLITEGSPCDHLAYLLAGGRDQRYYDFETPLPRFNPNCVRGIRSSADFRRAAGQSFSVAQIDQKIGCNLSGIIEYLDTSKTITRENDLLFVYIQGPTLQWINSTVNPEPIRNYRKFLDQINSYPGWKVIIDLSQNSGKLCQEYLNLYATPENSKTLIVTSNMNPNITDSSIGFFTDRFTDYLYNLITFMGDLRELDFRRFVREVEDQKSGPTIIAPQIIGKYSLKL